MSANNPGSNTETPQDGQSHQLPSDIVSKEFGEVNVRHAPTGTEILFTILMEPQGSQAEGWQTGVALDASGSMEAVYGKDIVLNAGASVPDALLRDYQQRGWMEIREHQGQKYPVLFEPARSDLVLRGYSRWSNNEIEGLARQMTAYLASGLDSDGGTTVIYWACGDGKQIEAVGDLTEQGCKTATFGGPTKIGFGQSTYLTPAVRYFVERFADSPRGMYIFVTDGYLHDLEDVKSYTTNLAKAIQAGKRNSVKCVLVGIGAQIDESQMEQLDDLDTGTDVDIWDHKIAREMRSLVEIFAEVVDENQIVAPTATIFDDRGNVVMQFSDGLPAKVSFLLPPGAQAFELEVAGRRIHQSIRLQRA